MTPLSCRSSGTVNGFQQSIAGPVCAVGHNSRRHTATLPALALTRYRRQVAPESRIVYVDNDQIVLAHARALPSSTPQGKTAYLDADAHDPDAILARAAETLDFSRPVAIMLLSILQVIDDPCALTAKLLRAVPAGSYLAISVPASDIQAEAQAAWRQRVTGDFPRPVIGLRSLAETARFFEGMALLEPGVVPLNHWRPGPGGPDPARALPCYGAVGQKR
jgi:hypothetical protein